VKASGEDTNGAFVAGVVRIEPMSGPPLHIHTREDEWFHILKGEFTFQVGEERLVAGPGASVFAPRGIQHTFQNFTGEVIEALVVVTPPALEGFFAEADNRAMSPAEFGALASRYGMDILGPPLTAE
jgi:mannose-6-phosphate isomerase-like protein (cupin superfamily)